MIYYFIYFGIAFLLSWLFLSPFAYFGKKYECFPIIHKDLPVYRKKTPYLAGAALYFGLIITVILFLSWKIEDIEFNVLIPANHWIGLLVGSGVLCLIALLDDIYGMPCWLKCMAELVAAILLVFSGIRSSLVFLDFVPITIADQQIFLGNALFSILWVLCVIHWMDLLEIFDGILVNLSFFIFLFLAAIGILGHDLPNTFLSLVLAGTVLGILADQMVPTNILLGRMGSYFLGFFVAALTLNGSYCQNNALGIVIPILLLSVPILVFILMLRQKFAKKTEFICKTSVYRQFGHIAVSNWLRGSLIITTVAGFLSIFIFLSETIVLAAILFALAVIALVYVSYKIAKKLPA